MVVKLAERDGIRTLNVVRRRESVAQLEALLASRCHTASGQPRGDSHEHGADPVERP
ncbi:hypothetical protein ACIRYZ_30970 [Kitasatospora sp. NPDC101155]|uniref:hypothetical protein n=1 Tax=Kitasatospora sp. NPDC101155 TaxID=3364097 RepID=UPI003816CCC0